MTGEWQYQEERVACKVVSEGVQVRSGAVIQLVLIIG